MNIPTINQLYAQIISSIESELNVTISPFGSSFLRAKAMVQAGVCWILYLAIAKVQKNIFVDTCDEETLGRFGQVKLGRDRFPATQGQYSVLVTGTTGATIVAGTIFRANDDALNPTKRFILDNDFVLDGINLITLRALEAGDESKLSAGNQLTAEAPIALVDSIVTVQSETIQPQPAETVEAYRNAIILAFRLEPQGGSPADYRLWSLEVQGVVNAYPYAASGLTSEVNLYIEADNVDGIPTPTDLQNVEDNIELPTSTRPARKPTTVIVNYLSINPRVIDINITGFVGLTVDIEALIYSALETKLSEIRPFIGAIDIVADRNDYFDTNSVISTILEVRPGSVFGAVTMEIDSISQNSITFDNGDIPKLNNVTYV
jgi:uncharacterized phage protein gp47/JayE